MLARILPIVQRVTAFVSFVIGVSSLRTMAWRSSADSNSKLVDNLQNNGIIKDNRVVAAMKFVDRAHFCGHSAYTDAPQGIGYAVTISAPHMHAHALELLSAHMPEGAHVLDVGSGSGYLTACIAHMIGSRGVAVGIEHIAELTTKSVTNLRKDDRVGAMLDSGQMKMVVGDGRLGYEEFAPFDAIHVGAAAPEIPPALTEQLKPGGRLIIPVGPEGHDQNLMSIIKRPDGSLQKDILMGVIYVPLTSKEKQWPSSRSKPEL